MKRTVAILIILILASCCALADVDDEILFRGLPWGATSEEFMATFPVKLDSLYETHLEFWSTMTDAYFSSSSLTKYTAGFACLDYDPGIKVAGYPVDGIHAEFVFSVDENGNINRDPAASRLGTARYTIDSEDLESTYADLLEKLTSVYGKCEEVSDVLAVWHGANGTEVRLHRSSVLVYIMYGSSEMEKEYREVDELLRQEVLEEEEKSRQENKTNTDGL